MLIFLLWKTDIQPYGWKPPYFVTIGNCGPQRIQKWWHRHHVGSYYLHGSQIVPFMGKIDNKIMGIVISNEDYDQPKVLTIDPVNPWKDDGSTTGWNIFLTLWIPSVGSSLYQTFSRINNAFLISLDSFILYTVLYSRGTVIHG